MLWGVDGYIIGTDLLVFGFAIVGFSDRGNWLFSKTLDLLLAFQWTFGQLVFTMDLDRFSMVLDICFSVILDLFFH
jgi:hypothetical protein